MDIIVQTPNVKITGTNLKCGLYRFALSSVKGSFISMAPEAFEIFIKIIMQFPNVEIIYRVVPQLGGSSIIMEYSKQRCELSVIYKNPKSICCELLCYKGGNF